MESLFSNPAFIIAALAFMAVYIMAMFGAIYLYVTKKSERAGHLLGVMVGLMFIFFLSSRIMSMAGGAPIDLRMLSDLITSVAFLFAAGGLLFKKARTILSLIFLLLLGPGVVLMMRTTELSGFNAGGMQILSVVFGLLWLMLIALIGYGYMRYGKKRKTPDH
jgi:hypothetical protein